jgi:two-component system KDP operon response regulator KdpE
VGIRVLIVEDDDSTRGALRAMLTSAGIEVVEAADEEEAVAAAAQSDPQVVLVDWSIPRGGLNLVRKLVGAHGMADRLVILSSLTDPRDRRAALEAGAARYLVKPPHRELLIDTIEEVARRTVQSAV